MATFNVFTTSDTINPNDGLLSLREAIIAAENSPGRDLITLPAGTITLNSSLPILQAGNDLDIQGFGSSSIISGDNQHQILTINGANVSIEGTSFINGLAKGGDGLNGGGGGLGAGGALFIYSGDVSVDESTFDNNRAQGGNGSIGAKGGNTPSELEDGQAGSFGGRGGNLNNLSFSDLATLGLNGGGIGGAGGAGGNGGQFTIADPGLSGSDGTAGDFGSGGAGGGGGGAGGAGSFSTSSGGQGGRGGNGGFGAGGGAGGGGGSGGIGNFVGLGGFGGSAGEFGGNGTTGFNGELAGSGGFGGLGAGGSGLGGAIFVREGATLEINNSIFTNNTANIASIGSGQTQFADARGGAIFVQDGANLTVRGLTFGQATNRNFSSDSVVEFDDISGSFTELPPEPQGQNNPLLNIDVGFHSVPTFIDENGDGDLDLFIGASDGTIAVAHNQGTASNPNFANPIVIRDVGNRSTPTFADIDGDGDQDLFVGDSFGRIHYYRNRGSVNGASFAPPVVNPFGIGANGGLAHPDLVDIDGDGDQDLFVGNTNGTILFYRNTGTRTSPNFVRSNDNPFGLQAVSGAAAPSFVDVGNDGDFDVFIGAADGRTRFF